MQKYHVCHICGGKMLPKIESTEYNFKGNPIRVDDIQVFRCENCGECILEADEVKRIEKIVLNNK